MSCLSEEESEIIVLYAIFKNAGIERKESVALLSLLTASDRKEVIKEIDALMDSREGCQFPTEQELLGILIPILNGRP